MNGAASINGFRAQAVLAVLDALDEQNRWDVLSVEPRKEQKSQNFTKVDIRWLTKGREEKHVQVKTRNRIIGTKDRDSWAKELADTSSAGIRELVVVGTVTGVGETTEGKAHGVTWRIRPDVADLALEAIANRVVGICQREALRIPLLEHCIDIAETVSSKVLFRSAKQERWTREQFDGLIRRLIEEKARSRATNPLSTTVEFEKLLIYLFEDGSTLKRVLGGVDDCIHLELPSSPSGSALSDIVRTAAGLVSNRRLSPRAMDLLRRHLERRKSKLLEAEKILLRLEEVIRPTDQPALDALPPVLASDDGGDLENKESADAAPSIELSLSLPEEP